MKNSFEFQVFSVTNGKANVFIRCPDETESMNDILINANHAEYIDEDYISNYNHLSRKSQFDFQAASGKIDNFVDPMTKDHLMEENVIHIDPPPAAMCKTKIKLKGPYSPLSIECYGLSKAARFTKTKIDRHSVNSVMLENDPQVRLLFGVKFFAKNSIFFLLIFYFNFLLFLNF